MATINNVETVDPDDEAHKRYQDAINTAETGFYITNDMLYGNAWYYTADWYREFVPGFPDEAYEIFEKFSNTSIITDYAAGVLTTDDSPKQ